VDCFTGEAALREIPGDEERLSPSVWTASGNVSSAWHRWTGDEAIAANLSAVYSGAAIWAHLKPVFGLAQRALFAAWFGWCAVVGLLLFKGNNRQSFSSSAFSAF
jgi:hypothetical protein